MNINEFENDVIYMSIGKDIYISILSSPYMYVFLCISSWYLVCQEKPATPHILNYEIALKV